MSVTSSGSVISHLPFPRITSSDVLYLSLENCSFLNEWIFLLFRMQFSRCENLCWRSPALPGRLQPGTIGRTGLNHRVRDGNGCLPCTHQHQQISLSESGLYEVLVPRTSIGLPTPSISLRSSRWSQSSNQTVRPALSAGKPASRSVRPLCSPR